MVVLDLDGLCWCVVVVLEGSPWLWPSTGSVYTLVP